MSHSYTRRRSAPRRAVIPAVLLGSAAAHAVIVGTVEVHTPLPGSMSNRTASLETAEGLSFSCVADAALATSARLGFCASPFSGGVDECMDSALVEFDLDRTKCHAVDIAFMDPEVADEIAPKPLMPDVAPIEDIVAARLLEEEVAEKLEEATREMRQPDPSGQVVEITRPQVEMPPEKARYLSEYDSSVKKEKVARGSTEKMVERPAPRELPPQENAPEPPKELRAPQPESAESAPQKPLEKPPTPPEPKSESVMAMRGPGTGKELPQVGRRDPGMIEGFEKTAPDGLAPKKGGGDFRSSTREPVLEPPGGAPKEEGGEAGRGPSERPNLRPSEELLSRAVGGGSVDKLDGVERGENTALNAKKWKYAAFFNRLKRQVAQNWHPDRVYLRRDPTGKVYGTKDRLTILRVSLTPRGELAKVYVLQQSGIDFLDDEAISAFRKAQPFPNPPGGLVESGSNLITFSFGFHFQIGDRSGWKLKWWR